MNQKRNKKGTKNGINLDYDYNTEYGDGDIPDVDKNMNDFDYCDDYDDYNER